MRCPCGRMIRRPGAALCSEHGPAHSLLFAAALVELERFDPFMAQFYRWRIERGEPIGRVDVQDIRAHLRDVVQGRRPVLVAASRRILPGDVQREPLRHESE